MAVYGDDDFDSEFADNPTDDEPEAVHEVVLCSGESVVVMTEKEESWFNRARDSYLSEHKFTESTDLADLDRLLVLELQLFRWTQYIGRGRDYDGIRIDEEVVRKQIKEVADSITKVKISLALDKNSRDKAANDGNFSAWFADALSRAKEFGLHRENQLKNALALMQEISAQVGAFSRSNEEERIKLGLRDEAAVVAWIKDDVVPRYNAIDEYFLNNAQKYWKKDL